MAYSYNSNDLASILYVITVSRTFEPYMPRFLPISLFSYLLILSTVNCNCKKTSPNPDNQGQAALQQLQAKLEELEQSIRVSNGCNRITSEEVYEHLQRLDKAVEELRKKPELPEIDKLAQLEKDINELKNKLSLPTSLPDTSKQDELQQKLADV